MWGVFILFLYSCDHTFSRAVLGPVNFNQYNIRNRDEELLDFRHWKDRHRNSPVSRAEDDSSAFDPICARLFRVITLRLYEYILIHAAQRTSPKPLCPINSHCLATHSSQRTTPPPQRFHFFLTREMANQSGSVSFQGLLESALRRYEKKTGITLSKHPLASQLQNCNSVEDFNELLQDKAKDVTESERITKPMRTIVSILTPLSSASLPDAVVQVR